MNNTKTKDLTPIRLKYQEHLHTLNHPIIDINSAWIKINNLHPNESEYTKEILCRDLLERSRKTMKEWKCDVCEDLENKKVIMEYKDKQKFPNDLRKNCLSLVCSNCKHQLFTTVDGKHLLKLKNP